MANDAEGWRPRRRVLLAAAALAVVLISGSTPTLVGDGGEYMAQAINFASGEGPALPARHVREIQQRIGEIDRRHAAWQMDRALTRGAGGGADFVHFWFYALLAAPVLALVDFVGAPPTAAFTVLNLAIVGLALWVTLPRVGTAASVFLFASPIVWYLDKPHTESFTFGLLAIVFAMHMQRPWWSMVAAGAAATQNPPIAVVVLVVGGLALVRTPAIIRDRRFLAGAATGLILVALHPLYTYSRHGTASLLLASTRPGTPAAAEVLALVFDPTLGLIGNFPGLFLVVGGAASVVALRRPRALVSLELLGAVSVAIVFLFSCARTTNLHHGGTPSFSRYIVWFIPLTIPLLSLAHIHGRWMWKAFSRTVASGSAVACIVAFHPAVRENAREPTWLASWLWTTAPQANNPVPEVFMETVSRTERFAAPAFTTGCEKILLGGRGDDAGMWPVPCYPQSIPARCRVLGTLCYANLRGGQYEFVRPPGRRRNGAAPNREWVWPIETEPIVRRLYDGWGWARLGVRPEGLDVLSAVQGVRVRALGTNDEFVLALRRTHEDAALQFQSTSPLWGSFIDPRTGHTVEMVNIEAGYPWDVAMPKGFDLLILTAQVDDH